MTALILVGIALALLGGFFALTEYETSHGVRFFAERRTALDQHVERIEFILEHVDLGAFLRDEVRNLFGRLSHTVAHLSLQVVRAIERLLTRLVRYLRSKHEVDTAPGENVREFVKTLSEFKDGLNATHPEISVSDASVPEVGSRIE